jgi:hypothetical protein
MQKETFEGNPIIRLNGWQRLGVSLSIDWIVCIRAITEELNCQGINATGGGSIRPL